MNLKTLLRTFSILILATSLVSCGTQPTPVPTVDAAPTLAAVRTEAAATVAAQIAAQASPTPLPATATSIPTEVPPTVAPPTVAPTVVPPTAVVVVPTRPAITLTPKATYTSTPSKYGCEVTSTTPDYKAEFSPRGDFDGKWVLKNTSDTTWDAGNFDIRYVSGTKFQENQDLTTLDLPASVKAGESVTIIVDMLAPADPGNYSASWVLANGDKVACNLSINIVVK